MDLARFDRLTRAVSRHLSRRGLAGALGLAVVGRSGEIAAKRKRKRKKKKKVTFNAFGCVNVGGFCKSSDQCCSGICDGKKGKKKCQAHDTGGCQAGPSVCGGDLVQCAISDELVGHCVTTTGNAGFCSTNGLCFACTKDEDCLPICGTHAACVICANCDMQTEGRACFSAGPVTCTIPT